MGRKGEIKRKTNETEISLTVEIDGQGHFTGSTGIGFFDHMLQLLARHSGLDLSLDVQGDLQVDGHHTVEDVGICLGQALSRAFGDKQGMARYGSACIPMDEALVMVSLDISGRPYLAYKVDIPAQRLGQFETELVEEFLRSLAVHAGITMHVHQMSGTNSHHIVEAVFKALAQALRQAKRIDPDIGGVLSTKGSL